MKPSELLDPEIAPVVEAMAMPALTSDVVSAIRSAPVPTAVADTVAWADHQVPGEPEVPVRVYHPVGADGPLPCLFWIHGGGYVLGSYTMGDATFSELSPELGLVGVSVEYRLAPETSYPGPLEDCYQGLLWTYQHADELGIDRTRIGIGGISAGGGLAAALALLARDRGEIPIAFQLLDCPMLDDRQTTESSRQHGLPVWSRESNAFGWQSYLGDLYGQAELPHTAAPARADDLSGLPATFISVGSVDGFLDEDVDYAQRLNRAGVATELHVYPGACHGYQLAADSRITRQSRRDVRAWLAWQLGVYSE